MTDDQRIYTAADLRTATWTGSYKASGKGPRGAFTIRIRECKIDGITVRGSVEEFSDGTKLLSYFVHGQNVSTLDEVAALMTGRWVAGDGARGIGTDD